MINEIIYKKIFSNLIKAKNILLICHIRPDGDALGSMSTMMEMLKIFQKNFTAYCQDKPTSNYYYLKHIEKITFNKNLLNFKLFDVIIAFDCGSLERTGLAEEIKARDKYQIFINIDHHPKIEDVADIEIKIPVASTTFIIYNFFKINQITINKNMANAILTGISLDTGNFLYSNTNEQVIKIAEEMIRLGARLPKIIKNTWHNKTLNSLKIWGIAMKRLQINKNYKIAFTYLKKEETDFINEEELEGLANFFGNLSEVKAIIILFEKSNNIIKGSIRTKCNKIDVSQLARLLGGGGHPEAAGFNIFGYLKKIDGKIQII